jgi:hypothetical protein
MEEFDAHDLEDTGGRTGPSKAKTRDLSLKHFNGHIFLFTIFLIFDI